MSATDPQSVKPAPKPKAVRLKNMDYTRKNDRLGPTPEGWAALLTALDANPDRQGEKYNALRDKLRSYFEHRGCDGAGRAADTVLDRVGRRLAAGATLTSTVAAFAQGIARNHWLELEQQSQMRQDNITHGLDGAESDLFESLPAPDPDPDKEILAECLDKCLQEKLKAKERETLLAYYNVPRGRDKAHIRGVLGTSLGKEAQALREHILRLRRRVEKCVRDCYEAASTR